MFDELRDMLLCELDEITQEGKLSAGTLDAVVDILKAVKTIDAIDMMESGQSYDDGKSYRHERGGGYSNARRRNRLGQFSRNGGYSRDGKSTVGELERMMEDAPDEKEREEIKHAIQDMMRKFQ